VLGPRDVPWGCSSTYCHAPLLVHSCCMPHQVTRCASRTAIDNTLVTLESILPRGPWVCLPLGGLGLSGSLIRSDRRRSEAWRRGAVAQSTR
jgi:hypothetical protein